MVDVAVVGVSVAAVVVDTVVGTVDTDATVLAVDKSSPLFGFWVVEMFSPRCCKAEVTSATRPPCHDFPIPVKTSDNDHCYVICGYVD